MTNYQKEFEHWFLAVESGNDEDWKAPPYLSKEWHAYVMRRQLALGAFNFALQLGNRNDQH